MDNKAYVEKNILNFEKYKEYNKKRSDYIMQIDDTISMLVAIKLRENGDIITSERKQKQIYDTPHIIELERKCECMERKLNKAVPFYSIIYMCVNSGIFSAALVLLILRFGFNIYIIDPYYLICAIIISLGLFATAVATLVDWKEYLKNNGKE